jgi:hypothetical protein
MKARISIFSLIVLGVMTLLLAACGSQSVSVAQLPVYPDAVQLQPGDSTIADTLENNMAQDEAIRQAMGSLGGGKTEQTGFQLPADTTWEQVKAFYAKELEANGWSSGLGGVAGMAVDVNAMMDTANQGNDVFQTAIWSKGKQTLSVIMTVMPTDSNEKMLILSLSSR